MKSLFKPVVLPRWWVVRENPRSPLKRFFTEETSRVNSNWASLNGVPDQEGVVEGTRVIIGHNCNKVTSVIRFGHKCNKVTSVIRFGHKCNKVTSVIRFGHKCNKVTSVIRFGHKCNKVTSVIGFGHKFNKCFFYR